MTMLIGDYGLDLDFHHTKKSLGMGKRDEYVYGADKTMNDLGFNFKKMDFAQYLTRFKWNNVPEGMDSELIERVLYFQGSAMFFYIKELDKFYFLPYGMTSEGSGVGIDFYGRFNKLKPYSFNGHVTSKGERNSKADIYLSTQIRDNIIDIPFVENEEEARKIYEQGGVICWDQTPQLAYNQTSRNRDSQAFIKYLIEALTQTKSAMVNSSGFNLFSSDSESGYEIMQLQLDSINEDRLKGKLSAVVSNMLGNVQNLQSNAPSSITDFWTMVQSIDNLRLKSMGIKNDGVIQKSQYQNQQEQELDIADSLQVYWNSFIERIKFSAIVNSIWGLGLYPEPLLLPQMYSETEANGDFQEKEGDDSQSQEGTNET